MKEETKDFFLPTEQDINLLQRCNKFVSTLHVEQSASTMYLAAHLNYFNQLEINNGNLNGYGSNFKFFVEEFPTILECAIQDLKEESTKSSKLSELTELAEQLNKRLKIHQAIAKLTEDQIDIDAVSNMLRITTQQAQQLVADVRKIKARESNQSIIFAEADEIFTTIERNIYKNIVKMIEEFLLKTQEKSFVDFTQANKPQTSKLEI